MAVGCVPCVVFCLLCVVCCVAGKRRPLLVLSSTRFELGRFGHDRYVRERGFSVVRVMLQISRMRYSRETAYERVCFGRRCRWQQWVENLQRIAAQPHNVVAANNLYDLHYSTCCLFVSVASVFDRCFEVSRTLLRICFDLLCVACLWQSVTHGSMWRTCHWAPYVRARSHRHGRRS